MSKEDKRISDYDNSGYLGGTEMIGAITYMVFGGLKKSYEHYYQVKYQKRNTLVGYLMSIILVGVLSYVMFLILID